MFFLFFVISALAYTQDKKTLITLNKKISNIELALDNIDVIFSIYEGKNIGYTTDIDYEKNLYIELINSSLRFRSIKPAKGTIYVYIPNDFLLDSCRVQMINSKLNAEKIKSVYFVVSVSGGTINVKDSMFKNTLISASNTILKFSSRIISVVDFCLNHSDADIIIKEKKENCNFLVSQNMNKNFQLDGKLYTKNTVQLSQANTTGTKEKNIRKTKKFITMSTSFSNINMVFKELTDEQLDENDKNNIKEKFNKYGISEFGPTHPPHSVNEISNFLPKQ